MKAVIIEDEIPAANELKKMLLAFPSGIEIVQELFSLQQSLLWFQANELPDIVFMDIELSDGLSLELIQKANITCPIIFVTAFDEYWQEAFEHNSIDYLLKPIKKERLETALNKFHELKLHFTSRYRNLVTWQAENAPFRERFLIRRGKEFISVKCEDIAFFYATHKLVCAADKKGAKYILDISLAEIEKQVAPGLFFRANRKYLIHKNAIVQMRSLPKSRLSIKTMPATPDELIVSSENSSAFKTWMGGGYL